ncbi:MAG: sugar transferase [Alphaproteobacteria bacterium]|nr:sugar transferase [Alphaproteobacteria bacterium]
MNFDSPITVVDREGGDETLAADFVRSRVRARSALVYKRCFDLVVTLALLPAAMISAPVIAAAIALDGGNPIYRHVRVGRGGRIFQCYKFRTMHRGAEESLERLLERSPVLRDEWNDHFKLRKDPRVTRLGRFLRKTSLDELPQMWNILRGEMSWVGPRPVTPAELPKYGRHLPDYLGCLPGITGLWQVSGRSDTTYEQRVQLDAEYAARWSAMLDLKILLLTVPRVLAARGSR